MPNSLFGNQPNNQMNQIKNMMNQISKSGNPNQMLNMFARTNPQISQVMNMMNSSGMSPKQFFLSQARQMGVDPEQIMNMFQ